MPWYAKPSGGYTISSTEGTANIQMINGYFNDKNYNLAAQAGIIGNMYHESALNPWRWENNTVNYSRGYGLFQFTPAREYIDNCKDVYGYSPNLSTSGKTKGAQPYDGWAQLTVMDEDKLYKWNSACWRSYWDIAEYSDLWELRDVILEYYGTNSITQEQYKTIEIVGWATFVFLACYEGPLVPNLDVRLQTAREVYYMLSGELPPQPPKLKKDGFKVWLALRHR